MGRFPKTSSTRFKVLEDSLSSLDSSSWRWRLWAGVSFPEDDGNSQMVRDVTYDLLRVDEATRSMDISVFSMTGGEAVMETRGLAQNVRGMDYMKLRESAPGYQSE